jgi:hypothetical protein
MVRLKARSTSSNSSKGKGMAELDFLCSVKGYFMHSNAFTWLLLLVSEHIYEEDECIG